MALQKVLSRVYGDNATDRHRDSDNDKQTAINMAMSINIAVGD